MELLQQVLIDLRINSSEKVAQIMENPKLLLSELISVVSIEYNVVSLSNLYKYIYFCKSTQEKLHILSFIEFNSKDTKDLEYIERDIVEKINNVFFNKM